MARDLAVSIPATGYLISAFAIGMIVGPLMAIVTLGLPRRTTPVAALLVFVVGHVLAALASDYQRGARLRGAVVDRAGVGARFDPLGGGGLVAGSGVMRTLLGWGRWAQVLFRHGKGGGAVAKVAAVRPLAGGRAPLIDDRLGLQTRGGAKLDQVDGTTCGSAVLVALAAWADPTETRQLDGRSAAVATTGMATGMAVGFGGRYDARQRQVHKESTKFWPQALGTSPWGMVAWLRRHAPGAGPYRVRLVDDRSPADVTAVIEATNAALAVGRPVPLLVGSAIPRHYCLALSATGDAWHVYEPTSGEVRVVPLDHVRRSTLAGLLGFDRLSAVLLPC